MKRKFQSELSITNALNFKTPWIRRLTVSYLVQNFNIRFKVGHNLSKSGDTGLTVLIGFVATSESALVN